MTPIKAEKKIAVAGRLAESLLALVGGVDAKPLDQQQREYAVEATTIVVSFLIMALAREDSIESLLVTVESFRKEVFLKAGAEAEADLLSKMTATMLKDLEVEEDGY